MGLDDAESRDGEVVDIGHEDADVAPVPALAFALLAGVGAVGEVMEIAPGWGWAAAEAVVLRAGAENALGSVSGCSRVVSALEGAGSLSEEVDVAQGLGVAEAIAAVGAAEEVVAAVVGQLEAALLKDDGHVTGDEDGSVQEPPVALRLDVADAPWDEQHTVGAGSDGCLDAFAVGGTLKVNDAGHGLLGLLCAMDGVVMVWSWAVVSRPRAVGWRRSCPGCRVRRRP